MIRSARQLKHSESKCTSIAGKPEHSEGHWKQSAKIKIEVYFKKEGVKWIFEQPKSSSEEKKLPQVFVRMSACRQEL